MPASGNLLSEGQFPMEAKTPPSLPLGALGPAAQASKYQQARARAGRPGWNMSDTYNDDIEVLNKFG